jgi:hypothetical protein
VTPPAIQSKANGRSTGTSVDSPREAGSQGKFDKFGEAPPVSMSMVGVACRDVLKEFGYRIERMDSEGREQHRSPNTGDSMTLFPSGWCSAHRRDGKALRAMNGMAELRHHLQHRHGVVNVDSAR